MNQKQAENLKPGSTVMHKRYGQCTVDQILPGFGPTIRPSTAAGLAVLARDSGTDIPDYLCDDVRNLSQPNAAVSGPAVAGTLHRPCSASGSEVDRG